MVSGFFMYMYFGCANNNEKHGSCLRLSSVGHLPRTVSQLPETSCNCRLIGYRKPQNTRQIPLLSGVSPGRYPSYPRLHATVDSSDTENRKTPERSLFCRASAQDGIPVTRDPALLSTNLIPKTSQHPRNRSSVGRQPRTVSQLPETRRCCRLN